MRKKGVKQSLKAEPAGFPARHEFPVIRKKDGSFSIQMPSALNVEATAKARLRRDRGSMTNPNSIARRSKAKVVEHRAVIEQTFGAFENLERMRRSTKDHYEALLQERNDITAELEALRLEARDYDREERAARRRLENSCMVLYAHRADGVKFDGKAITILKAKKRG